MNNGKVRIYDLSRELNLDNKDILAVCERLNISVKSHSSTITESEAERIRKTAEKYVASHSSPGKPAPPERAAAPSRESGPHPNDQQKKTANFRNTQSKSTTPGWCKLPAVRERGEKKTAGNCRHSSQITRRSTAPASG
jgi:bacterial translation initiation factor 2 (bIF-2)